MFLAVFLLLVAGCGDENKPSGQTGEKDESSATSSKNEYSKYKNIYERSVAVALNKLLYFKNDEEKEDVYILYRGFREKEYIRDCISKNLRQITNIYYDILPYFKFKENWEIGFKDIEVALTLKQRHYLADKILDVQDKMSQYTITSTKLKDGSVKVNVNLKVPDFHKLYQNIVRKMAEDARELAKKDGYELFYNKAPIDPLNSDKYQKDLIDNVNSFRKISYDLDYNDWIHKQLKQLYKINYSYQKDKNSQEFLTEAMNYLNLTDKSQIEYLYGYFHENDPQRALASYIENRILEDFISNEIFNAYDRELSSPDTVPLKSIDAYIIFDEDGSIIEDFSSTKISFDCSYIEPDKISDDIVTFGDKQLHGYKDSKVIFGLKDLIVKDDPEKPNSKDFEIELYYKKLIDEKLDFNFEIINEYLEPLTKSSSKKITLVENNDDYQIIKVELNGKKPNEMLCRDYKNYYVLIKGVAFGLDNNCVIPLENIPINQN